MRGIMLPLLLTLFAVPFAAMQYKVPTILPDLIVDLGLYGQTGPWLITMFTLTGVVMTLCAGPLANKIGLSKTLLIAAAFAVGGSLVGVAFSQPLPLVVSRGIEGIGFAIVCVCGPVAIERAVPRERQGVANGIWSVWIPVGAFVGEVVSPVVYQSALGFAGLWLAIVIPIAALALFVYRAVASSAAAPEDSESSAGRGPEAQAQARGRRLFTSNFALFLIAWLSFNLLNFSIMSYGPSYLQTIGFDSSLSGFVVTIPMLLSIATGPIGGILVDKFHRPKLMLLVALAFNALTTFMLFTSDGIMVWVSVILMGLFATLTFVATLSSIESVLDVGADYSLAVSVYMFVQVFGELAGGFISPLILGPALSDWTVFAWVWGIAGCVGLLCAVGVRFRRE